MKNLVQDGKILSLVMGADILAGKGVLVGSIFGVVAADTLNGGTAEVQTLGVFTLPKAAGDDVAVGAKLYWDNTNKVLTLTATANTLVGVATAAAGTGVASVDCRLNGSF